MKFFTLPSLAAAAIFSAVVVVPFVAGPKKKSVGSYALEVSMTSTRPGIVQVYYPDATGALSESASSKLPLVPGSSARVYRLPLPAGRFDALRLDPLTRAGAVAIDALRII